MKLSRATALLKELEWKSNVGAYYEAEDGCGVCGEEKTKTAWVGIRGERVPNQHRTDCRLGAFFIDLEKA